MGVHHGIGVAIHGVGDASGQLGQNLTEDVVDIEGCMLANEHTCGLGHHLPDVALDFPSRVRGSRGNGHSGVLLVDDEFGRTVVRLRVGDGLLWSASHRTEKGETDDGVRSVTGPAP